MAAAAFPGVETNVVVIAASGEESRFRATAEHQLETEDTTIESERALEIGHLEMDVANTDTGVDRGLNSRAGGRLRGKDCIGQGRALQLPGPPI
jgi:hypothetical protein